MALTRADYLEHAYAIVKRWFNGNEDHIPSLLASMAGYVQNGNRGTQAERREAARILGILGAQALGFVYNAHQYKHLLGDTQDVPNLSEPLT